MAEGHFLRKTSWRTWVLFVGPLIPLFWTFDFWWCLLWASEPGWAVLFECGRGICVTCSPRLYLVLRLSTSWWLAWPLRWCLPHTCDQVLVGLKWETYRAAGERSAEEYLIFLFSSFSNHGLFCFEKIKWKVVSVPMFQTRGWKMCCHKCLDIFDNAKSPIVTLMRISRQLPVL